MDMQKIDYLELLGYGRDKADHRATRDSASAASPG